MKLNTTKQCYDLMGVSIFLVTVICIIMNLLEQLKKSHHTLTIVVFNHKRKTKNKHAYANDGKSR